MHGDSPAEPEMVGDAVFLGDPLIRRNDRMAVMATLPTADDRACPQCDGVPVRSVGVTVRQDLPLEIFPERSSRPERAGSGRVQLTACSRVPAAHSPRGISYPDTMRVTDGADIPERRHQGNARAPERDGVIDSAPSGSFCSPPGQPREKWLRRRGAGNRISPVTPVPLPCSAPRQSHRAPTCARVHPRCSARWLVPR